MVEEHEFGYILILHLLRMRYPKYCMDVWCSFSIKVEMDGLDSLILVRDCVCGCVDGPSDPCGEYKI